MVVEDTTKVLGALVAGGSGEHDDVNVGGWNIKTFIQSPAAHQNSDFCLFDSLSPNKNPVLGV